jgi:hypothetical protein
LEYGLHARGGATWQEMEDPVGERGAPGDPVSVQNRDDAYASRSMFGQDDHGPQIAVQQAWDRDLVQEVSARQRGDVAA